MNDDTVRAETISVTWEWVFKIIQVIVIPLLVAVLYQVTSMEKRLTVIEVKASNPPVDVELARKIAVIEDRQNEVRNQLRENGNRIERLTNELAEHDIRAWEKRR